MGCLRVIARHGWRLCGAVVSDSPFSPMPQLNSQPVSHELNTPLSLSLRLSLSLCIFGSLNLTRPQCQRHLMSPCLLPMPTACPATNSACLSGNPLYPSFCLLLCMSCLSIFSLSIPPVCLLCFICLTICQPYCFSPILWQKVSNGCSLASLPYLHVYSASLDFISAFLWIRVTVCPLPCYLSHCKIVQNIFRCIQKISGAFHHLPTWPRMQAKCYE